MSVAPQMKQNSLDDERRAHEPSMEEILASIRRIIADDDALSTRRRDPAPGDLVARRTAAERPFAAPSPKPAPSPDHALDGDAADAVESAFRLGREESSDQGAELAIFRKRDATEATRFSSETATAPESGDEQSYKAGAGDYPRQSSTDASVGEADAGPLVSPEAEASVASHFEALAASMFIRDAGLLQDYAKELLRPMLKQWLDDNLPVMVERLVRAEIERVARGRR